MKQRVIAILLIIAMVMGLMQVSSPLVYAASTEETVAVENEDAGLEKAQAEVLANEEENSFRFEDGEYIEPEVSSEGEVSTLTSKLYSIEGIDVSKWQGTINWSKVKNEVDFAVLRCSNSTITIDPYWKKNADACTANNIPFGVYIYSKALTTTQAKKEAQYALSLVKGYDLEYPIFFDIEDTAVTKYKLSNSQILAMCKTFCETIEAAGYQAGVYSSKSWWTTYLTSDTYGNWDRWVARYNSAISESGYTKSHQFWQYTESGKVSGISGNVDKNYAVSYKSVSGLNIKLSATSYTYDGTAKKPSVSINKLTKGIDYTLTYKNNINVGTASVTINGIGSYKGSKTVIYKINSKTNINDNNIIPEEVAKDISKLTAKLSYTSYLYTGTQRKPSVKISGLTNGEDYSVSYQNNVYPGTASVTIKGKGNYNGTLKKTFTIVLAKVKGISTKVTSNSVKLSWSKQEGVTGYRIYRYNSSTKEWKLIKKITSASTTSYTNTGLKLSTSYQYRIRSYCTRKSDGKNYYGEYSSICKAKTSSAKPAKVTITSLKSAKAKNVTVKWNKVTSANGYVIEYATNSKFTSSTKLWIISGNNSSWTMKNLKSKKTYYVKVRAYNTVNGVRYYGSYGVMKSVKCK